jgi:hypothetical protein
MFWVSVVVIGVGIVLTFAFAATLVGAAFIDFFAGITGGLRGLSRRAHVRRT